MKWVVWDEYTEQPIRVFFSEEEALDYINGAYLIGIGDGLIIKIE